MLIKDLIELKGLDTFYLRILGYNYPIVSCKNKQNDHYVVIYGFKNNKWELNLTNSRSWVRIPSSYE